MAKEIDWAEVVGPNGRTKAHEAAKNGSLPPDFDQWNLSDDNGKTVRDVDKDRIKDLVKTLEKYVKNIKILTPPRRKR